MLLALAQYKPDCGYWILLLQCHYYIIIIVLLLALVQAPHCTIPLLPLCLYILSSPSSPVIPSVSLRLLPPPTLDHLLFPRPILISFRPLVHAPDDYLFHVWSACLLLMPACHLRPLLPPTYISPTLVLCLRASVRANKNDCYCMNKAKRIKKSHEVQSRPRQFHQLCAHPPRSLHLLQLLRSSPPLPTLIASSKAHAPALVRYSMAQRSCKMRP